MSTTRKKRATKRYCNKGHDRYEKGEPLYGHCRECDRLRKLHLAAEKAKDDPAARRYTTPLTSLKEIRLAVGVSQVTLGKMAGLDPSTISYLERGHFDATRLVGQKIGDALKKLMRENPGWEWRLKEMRRRQSDRQTRLERAGLL